MRFLIFKNLNVYKHSEHLFYKFLFLRKKTIFMFFCFFLIIGVDCTDILITIVVS